MITVIKRNGKEEAFDAEKLNKWAEWASNNNVSWSGIVLEAMRKLTNGCTTTDIQKALISVCVDKADYDHLDMAARLLVGKIYKEVHGSFTELPNLMDFYNKMVAEGKWVDMGYSDEELEYLDQIIDHNKDFTYKYSTIKQVTDKYAIKHRKTGEVFETPQFVYMGVALANMQNQPSERRLEDVEKLYTYLSDLKINAPTPTLGGLRTNSRGLASCCLFTTLDTADSINIGTDIAYTMTCANAGIGGYVHTRSVGDSVRDGTIEHTGKLPYYRYYEAAVKATKQANRGGAATMYYAVIDPEISDLLALKHQTTPSQMQIRGMDYSCLINKFFVQKALKNEQWMLMSANTAPDLWNAFFSGDEDLFKDLYGRYEASSLPKKFVSARDLALLIERQWYETGRIYKTWVDELNRHTPFKDKIYSSNLCKEIALPTKGFEKITDLYSDNKDSGEVALCFIGAIVAGRVTASEYEDVAYYTALMIDNTMDLMEYPYPQVKATAQARRSIGVGIVNLAAHIAMNGKSYSSVEGKQFIHDHAEMHSYYLHRASLRLAHERGVCEWIDKTKYPQGWLPIDTYNTNVDTVVSGLKFDWEGLRKDIIAAGGIRNSVLEATMPAESSSQASNTTNSIYPVRKLLIIKGGSSNKVPCFVPEYSDIEVRGNYERCWDIPYKDMVDLYAIVQKFHGQAISADFYFSPEKYHNNKIGSKEMLTNLAYTTKMGLKTNYYLNTKSKADEEEGVVEKENLDDCESCKI